MTAELLIKVNAKLGYTVLNKSLVGSAVSSWHYYNTPKEQISSIVGAIIKNHPFQDGNKRTATVVYYTLCKIANLQAKPDSKMLLIVVDIAENQYDVAALTKILF